MKTLPFIALFAVLVVTSSYVSTSIDTPATAGTKAASFKQFIVHRQGSNVAMSWSISSLSVTEFQIERSYDGEFFDIVGTVPCNGTTTHRYRDVSVFPGTIWYRITAVNADQTVASTATESVRIVKH